MEQLGSVPLVESASSSLPGASNSVNSKEDKRPDPESKAKVCGSEDGKKPSRRWKLFGDVLGRGAFSSVWGARMVTEDQDKGLVWLEDEPEEIREEMKGVVAVKMM